MGYASDRLFRSGSARSLFHMLRDRLADRGRDTLDSVSEYVASGWTLLSSDSRVLRLQLAVTQGTRFSVPLRLDPEIKQNFDMVPEEPDLRLDWKP